VDVSLEVVRGEIVAVIGEDQMIDPAALKRLLTGTLTPFELRVDHQLVWQVSNRARGLGASS